MLFYPVGHLCSIRLLDKYSTAQEVREALLDMATPDWLDSLSDKQWEVLCDQYLRDTVGLRSLVLAVGRTLKDVDIYGVGQGGKRILAQCKHNSETWKKERLIKLVAGVPRNPKTTSTAFSGAASKGEAMASTARCRQ